MTAAFEPMDLDADVPVRLGSDNELDAIRILLIEDGGGFLADELSKHGFAVQSVTSLAGALDAVGDADVIVLHRDWTKVPGIELLDKLQRQTAAVPIVLLAGDVSRSSDVLVTRLKDVAKAIGRTVLPQGGAMVCGKLLLRPDIGRAYWKDADLGFTLGEYKMVHLLASNVGRYVTYRAIYDRLHHEGFIAGAGAVGYRANVRSAIKRIRNKFRSLDPTFDGIENYNGFGYCWKKPD